MRRIIFGLVLLASLPLSAQKKDITLKNVYEERAFNVEVIRGYHSTTDGLHYTEEIVEGDNFTIIKKSIENPDFQEELFTSANKDIENIESYSISPDENYILLFTRGKRIYRRSSSFVCYLYDRSSDKLIKVSDEHILHASLSPDNQKVAYVLDNNLYYKNLADGVQHQITSDGKVNEIINGNCDWVYEEEFGFTKAYKWSPDSRNIAYYRFDESDVREYTLQYYEDLYPRNYTYKYPKAGEDNSKLKLYNYTLNTAKSKEINVPIEEEYYIPRIFWASPDRLVLISLDRLQQEMNLWAYNPNNEEIFSFYNEKENRYVEISDNFYFLKDNSCIMTSERDGYNHIYCISPDGKGKKQLTKGKWEVREVLGIDPEEEYIYYTSTEVSPLENHLYRITVKGKKKERLSQESGWHDFNFTNGMKYYLDVYSSYEKLPTSRLCKNDGSVLRVLEDNSVLESTLQEYKLASVEEKTFELNGEKLNGIIYKPDNFDPNKKYPVLLYQYSGPGYQLVKNEYFHSNHFLNNIFCSKGYIVVTMDGRGTGGRGAEFKKQTYGQLGKYESDDQIALGKYLAGLDYVDEDRIGIWGWSYGGFMSSICILKGADVFKTAVAVAPVTNWRYYDNIYTERYMGLPKDNSDGYDDNSPTSMVSKLKGNFLIIHGLTDDNVHFQNSAMLVDALVKESKQFDAQYYPNVAHSMGYARINLYQKLIDYITEKL